MDARVRPTDEFGIELAISCPVYLIEALGISGERCDVLFAVTNEATGAGDIIRMGRVRKGWRYGRTFNARPESMREFQVIQKTQIGYIDAEFLDDLETMCQNTPPPDNPSENEDSTEALRTCQDWASEIVTQLQNRDILRPVTDEEPEQHNDSPEEWQHGQTHYR